MNARLAGFTYFFYFAAGISELVVFARATRGAGIADKLASIAQHTTLMRLSAVLSLATTMSALVLAVTLYALTRDYDRDLALIAMSCRIAEGVTGAMHYVPKMALVRVATSGGTAANEVGSALLNMSQLGLGFVLFAVANTIYSYLFLRARTIPRPLAWLGVVASGLLVVDLPLEMVGVIAGTWLIWMPALVFELTLASWLLTRGVATQEQTA